MHADLNDPVSRRGLGLIVLVGALLMVGLGVSDLLQMLNKRKWPAVPCQIVASRVTIAQALREERPYRFEVGYQYQWAGKPYTGHEFGKRSDSEREIADADRLARRYPVGAQTTCYVNPEHPDDAVLVRGELYDPIGIIAISVVFFVPLGIYLLLPRRRQMTRSGKVAREDRTFLMYGCVFGVFCGMASFIMFFAIGMYRDLVARRWTVTPCRIIASHVRSHTVSGGEAHFTAYAADVAYSYQVAGREYRSSRFNFTERSTPWFYGKRALVESYRPRQQATCYVNPADPTEAVLTLGWRVSVWFGLWPIVMTLGAGWALLGMLGLASHDISMGDPRLDQVRWLGPVAVALLAGFTTQLFLVLGSDLARDWQAGRADGWEWAWVIIAGLAMAGSMALFIALLLRRRSARRALAQAA